MRVTHVLGALLVSVALCNAGFGARTPRTHAGVGGMRLHVRLVCVVRLQMQRLRGAEVLLSRAGLLCEPTILRQPLLREALLCAAVLRAEVPQALSPPAD